jgi:hypothetical protein
MAIVSGDPSKKGMFTIQLKMPADYAVPPHSHPTNEIVKVVSGKLHYGMGDKLDTASAKTLTVGHGVTMKAKMSHWVHAPAPATVQVSGMGPSRSPTSTRRTIRARSRPRIRHAAHAAGLKADLARLAAGMGARGDTLRNVFSSN